MMEYNFKFIRNIKSQFYLNMANEQFILCSKIENTLKEVERMQHLLYIIG